MAGASSSGASVSSAIDAAAQSMSRLLFDWVRSTDETEPNLFDELRNAEPSSDSEGLSAMNRSRASVLLETPERQNEMLLEALYIGNYRMAEIILGAIQPITDVQSRDELWGIVIARSITDENKSRKFMNLLNRRQMNLSDAKLSELVLGALEAGDMTNFNYFVELEGRTTNHQTRRREYSAFISRLEPLERAKHDFDTFADNYVKKRSMSIFKPAALWACANGRVDVLITFYDMAMNERDWFPDASQELLRAACGRKWSPTTTLPNLNVQIGVLKYLLEHGTDAAHVDWSGIGPQNTAKLLPYVDRESLPRLPPNIRQKIEDLDNQLRLTAHRARYRLDKPPTAELGTSHPTHEQLIENLRTGGKRFAREYWEEGIPLFFPGQESKLGPVPDEFKHVAPLDPLDAPVETYDGPYEDDGLGKLSDEFVEAARLAQL